MLTRLLVTDELAQTVATNFKIEGDIDASQLNRVAPLGSKCELATHKWYLDCSEKGAETGTLPCLELVGGLPRTLCTESAAQETLMRPTWACLCLYRLCFFTFCSDWELSGFDK